MENIIKACGTSITKGLLDHFKGVEVYEGFVLRDEYPQLLIVDTIKEGSYWWRFNRLLEPIRTTLYTVLYIYLTKNIKRVVRVDLGRDEDPNVNLHFSDGSCQLLSKELILTTLLKGQIRYEHHP